MDRGSWWATVHGGHKESDMTEQLSTHTQRQLMGSGWELELSHVASDLITHASIVVS